ncbi:hypothetical protein E3N88_27579 [Mikania micrantha]|uniref:PARP-type domain-containing protein n=1 Tax=Mikania micrantha TaxID=192012 RepID=A0A5N6MX64_9ASTR|nr:hypothetical protein E3N88_27579 [Mikania micrantha]
MSSASSTKIVAEYAKSGKSSCKKCSEKIDSKYLRLGLKIRVPRGYDYIKWHHFHCFSSLDSISVSSIEAIEGFSELTGSDQDKLKKMASEGDQSSTKTNEDVEARKGNKSTKEKIIAEYAKSGKSSCKMCFEKIDYKYVRLGLSSWDLRGFENTKWHHLDCLFTLHKELISPESIEGFLKLNNSDQDKLKKQVAEGGHSSKKTDGDEQTWQEKKATKDKIVAEYAKSGKSSCKKCSEKIESKSLRLGLSSWDPRGFVNTRWHHVDCFFTLDKDIISLESIEGFLELKSYDQDKLKKLVTEVGHYFDKREGDEETELDRRDLKKLKTDEDEEDGNQKKVTKEKIVAEYAKSGKSSCKKCSEKIEYKSLRLGLSSWDPRGFENTKWHHLGCFFTLDKDIISLESIEGFLELKSNDQEKLKNLGTEGGRFSKKRAGDEEIEPDRRHLKKLKTNENEEDRQGKKVSNEKSNDQEKMKKLVTEGHHSSKKTNEDEEAGKGKRVAKEMIVAKYAKSGKSSCKKCYEKIESKSLKLGLSSWDPRGFENIKWHHLDCFFTLDKDFFSLESIEGFLELKSNDQEKLKKLVTKKGHSSKKIDEHEETRQGKKVTNEKIVAEYAKSGKTSCKKCYEKIESKSLRLGLSSWDTRGFENTKWHHLDCFFTQVKEIISLESIEGLLELKNNDQEKLKKLVTEGGHSSKKTDKDEEARQGKKVMKEKIVAGYAKSGKSSCKKCSEKIESKSLRLGLISWDPRGFENTKWHHLDCFFTIDKDNISLEPIEGFLELKSNDQEKLKNIVTERCHSSKKGEGDEVTEPDKIYLKKRKIVAEYAKSGKSSCKKCSEKIESKSLRLGLISWDPRGFENTKWHHVDCFFTLDKDIISLESIEGFLELKSNDQEKVKNIVTEGCHSSKKGEGDEVTEPDKIYLKKLKTDEDEEAMQGKKVMKEKIVAEYAKSEKSSCKKCSEKIESKSLRLGLISWDPRGFENTKWHHVDCFLTLDKDIISLESIEGILELKNNDQEKLKKVVTERGYSSKKTDEDEEARQGNNVMKEKIVVEYAKSGKSSCKKCSEKIEYKSLRLGLVSWDPRGFENTKWHHIDCFFTLDKDIISLESIEGFFELKSNDQEKLKNIVTERCHSSKKGEGDEVTEPDKIYLKKLKTDEDEEARQGKKVMKEKVVAEYAKSGKSSCKKCSEKIESKSLRLGLISWDPRGFQNTKWHHVDCFFTLDKDIISLESIEGYLELKSNDQEELKKLVTQGGHSSMKSNDQEKMRKQVAEGRLASKKREGDDVTEPDRIYLKKLKTDEDEEAGQGKKVTKEKIVAEYAKSGKSSCKKCSEKIEFRSLRLGLISWDRRGFKNTKWHHLDCFFTLDKDMISQESIEGFLELESKDQEKLKKLVNAGGHSSNKTDEDGEARKGNKVTKEKIVAEYAKSGKSSCKKCSKKIESESLRLGLSSWDPRGFEYTKWHHLDCFFTLDKDPIAPESIEEQRSGKVEETLKGAFFLEGPCILSFYVGDATGRINDNRDADKKFARDNWIKALPS